MTTTEARDAAIREARRYIRDVVRNDWAFEPSSSPRPYSVSTDPDREVVQWRLREYDSSGSELEPEPDPEPYPGGQIAVEEDGEGEMGAVIADDRHRRRRRQMAEEMSWNEGLRTWMERRDAWAGAKARRSFFGNERKKGGRRVRKGKGKGKHDAEGMASSSASDGPVPEGGEDGLHPESEMVSGSPSSGAVISSSSSHHRKEEDEAIATRTETSLTLADKDGSQHNQNNQNNHVQPSSQDKECDHSTADAEEKRKVSSETAITEPDDSPTPTDDDDEFDGTGEEEEELDSLEEPYIPVVPSLISKTNPIRASITPSMYPSIYTKVVVQGLTPTVPINLADVTKAMVQGWKTDGQWPHKPVNTSIVLPDDATVGKPSTAPGADANAGGSTETKRRRSSGVANAVRKVLHFSGHPFHRRGASQDQDGATNAER